MTNNSKTSTLIAPYGGKLVNLVVPAGIDDPYEPPRHAEITLDTLSRSPEENARLILDYLIQRGFVRRLNSATRVDEAGCEQVGNSAKPPLGMHQV
jgi:hypothetical protein